MKTSSGPTYFKSRLALLLIVLWGSGLLGACGGARVTPAAPAQAPTAVAATATRGPLSPTLPEPPTPTAMPTPEPTPTPSPIPPPTVHVVQPGDTLLGLAYTYGVPVAAFQLLNGLGDSTLLSIGQELLVPNQSAWAGVPLYWIVHTVHPNETLSGIAAAYDIPLQRLLEVNRLTLDTPLPVGRDLILPAESPLVARNTAGMGAGSSGGTGGGTTKPPSGSVWTPITAPPPADVADWPAEVIRLINEIRVANGLQPLVYNGKLATIAQSHANDCAARGWCSHTGSDGSTYRMRMAAIGYAARYASECWAQSRNPAHAINMWMDEVPPYDAHRRTILSAHYTEIGVGVAQTTWGYYFVADFGQP